MRGQTQTAPTAVTPGPRSGERGMKGSAEPLVVRVLGDESGSVLALEARRLALG